MTIKKWHPIIVSVIALPLFFWTGAHAIKDKDNQGRWTKPVENGPDQDVPGFLVNLGPTGARAVLTEKTFIVRYIFKGSPAEGYLKLNDVITGVFGKPFAPHTFGGDPHGYEGPIMNFGDAIEQAEGKDGKLVLNVSRDTKTLDVTVQLEAIGSFSSTFPIQCKKSEQIRARALKYLTEHPESLQGPSHARAAVTLAMLTSGNPQQESIGKKAVLSWNNVPGAGTWTWHVSYQLITLSEYYLLTGDSTVLPTIKATADLLKKDQYKGQIVVWKAGEKEDPAKIDAAQQLYDGGFGHSPYVSGVGKNGYGPMQFTTILAVIGWQLAERCGVEVEADCIKRALDFIHRGTNDGGAVAYGGEFTLNNGLVDPVKWKKSTGGMNYVGRVGASIIAHKLSPEYPASTEYLEKNKRYVKRTYKSLPDGHADSMLGFSWGLLGAAASEDESVMRTIYDYHKAWINMMRCHDGSFVILPGRDYADGGYYISSRYHSTGVMALVLGLGNPKLQIQGIQVNLPGVNPKALKGSLLAAYKALINKSYTEAARALKSAGRDDATAYAAIAGFLSAQMERDVALLEALEKKGDILRLQSELSKLRSTFGSMEGFDEKVARFDESLRQEAWKTELKVGANYSQLVGMLTRNKSAAYAGDLEKFAEKHADSLYGKWALQVAKEYRATGSVKDPSAELPNVSAPAHAAPAAVTDTSSSPASSAPSVKPEPAKTVTTNLRKEPVSPEMLELWQTRFVSKLDSLARSGVKLELPMGSQEKYFVRSANDKTLIVNIQGNDLPMPWKQLTLSSRTALARVAAKADDVEALLIAAVLHLASGDASEAEEFFAKAAIKDAEAVKSTRAALSSR
jgi:hypothetical protein